jgi:hypothetical protein
MFAKVFITESIKQSIKTTSMKKVFLVAAFVVAGFISTNAQEFQFGAGPVVALPIGDAGDISSFAIGAELQGEYKFSDMVSGVGTTGYTHFIGKEFAGYKINYGAVPILVGARVYPSEQFFIGGQIGYGFFTGDASGGGFAYRPQIGYNAPSFQLGLSYSGISDNGGNISWIGLTGIFKFGGSK